MTDQTETSIAAFNSIAAFQANVPGRGPGPFPRVRNERSQVAGLARTSDAEVRKIVNAMAAAVANAQAGLNWLCAQPSDLEEVRQALASIVSEGKQACEMVIRLRNNMNEGACGGYGFQ